jgi:hypothetical protein
MSYDITIHALLTKSGQLDVRVATHSFYFILIQKTTTALERKRFIHIYI